MRHFFHHLKKSLANLFKGRLISNDLSCQSYQYYQNYHYSHYIQNDACIQFNDPRNYLFLYHNCTKNNFINTNVEISFSRSLKFGCSIKDIKSKFSLGKYHLQKIKDKQIEILIFKMLIGNHKAKCHLHFFKGHLFYYQFSFQNLNKGSNIELIKTLQEKYLFGIDLLPDQIITDNFNNCIQIEDDIDLNINYLSLNSAFFWQFILNTDYSYETKTKKDSRQHKEMFARL